MMYLKLSIRNAKRSFIDYLLYVVTMTVLLAIIEVSNCITIIGESAGFQVIWPGRKFCVNEVKL